MTTSSYAASKNQALPLIKQAQFQEALAILEGVETTGHIERLEWLEMLAVCYFRLGYLEKAAVCYQQLSEEDPHSAKPLINLGATYNRLKQFPEAITSLRKAVQRDKSNVDAYYNLGFAQRHAGHPELAVSAYKEAVRLNPQLEQGHLNLASCYLEMKNAGLALSHFQQALNLNPELEAARRGLERAQKLDEELQIKHNPFGRLVDVTQLGHQKTACATRTLTEAEREKDRRELLSLIKAIRNAARHTSEELREKMQPSLLALTRALIDGENRPDLIADNHDRFREELPRLQECLRQLKRHILELRGHEEFMNTPDLKI